MFNFRNSISSYFEYVNSLKVYEPKQIVIYKQFNETTSHQVNIEHFESSRFRIFIMFNFRNSISSYNEYVNSLQVYEPKQIVIYKQFNETTSHQVNIEHFESSRFGIFIMFNFRNSISSC
ncbi:Hypothetical protein CINCED_3A017011 [Cinara cedri]|uniref:Uncharacterized protein n=1 Tax=Cinara cedri TaxID=506608 RepID=A0A5E4NC09_9HEMI|nr:Hypothetical protein CINCED_3A017011 [Cinara cedri]